MYWSQFYFFEAFRSERLLSNSLVLRNFICYILGYILYLEQYKTNISPKNDVDIFINSFYNMKNILNLKRGRSSVGRYHTKQQTLILEYLALKRIPHLPQSRSGADCWGGGKVGRATVYRALDRLVEAGTILKIPSGDGNRALYRYMGKQPSLQRADGLPGLRTGISSGVLPSRGTDPAYSERPPI